jgi:geranylgeranyl diphosphate synthase type I
VANSLDERMWTGDRVEAVSDSPASELDPVSADFRGQVSDVIEDFIAAKQSALAPIGAELTPLIDAARQAVGGGKRLRPAFVYWGWRAAGGSRDKDAIISAAASVELVHASALVHDDVMDNSATRRGAPSAHAGFTRMRLEDPRSVESERFGVSAAILLGDLLLAWSDELLTGSGFKPKAVARGRVYFDKLRTEVVAGQYLDVLAQTSHSSSASDAMRVLRYKSAKYTVERPLQFGAALADADRDLLTALSSYGIPLGEAFQLRDDVLGVFGESDVTGKPSGDDLREGKRTLLAARAFSKADAEQREVLAKNFGRADVDAAGIAAMQDVLRDTGALAAVETVIAELTNAARGALKHAPIGDRESRDALLALTDRATQRAN